MSPGLVIPDRLRSYTLETSGDAGQEWLRLLPALVEDLATRWHLTLGEAHPDANRSMLLRAWTRSGRAAALKIEPRPSRQVDALVVYGRHGAGPEVLARDDAIASVLMSWEPGPTGDQASPHAVMAAAARVLTELATEHLAGLPVASERTIAAAGVARQRLSRLPAEDLPFDLGLLDLDADRAGHNTGPGLLHGDLVGKNLLLPANADTVLFIDPEPLAGRPEMGLANLANRLADGAQVPELLRMAAAEAAKHGLVLDEDLLAWNAARSARTYVAYRIAMGRAVSAHHARRAQRFGG